MPKIVQVTPCEGWYHVSPAGGVLPMRVEQVAAWGLTDAGDVVGLVPRVNASNPPTLVPIQGGGRFIPERDLKGSFLLSLKTTENS